jgi:hypothetical protein
MTSIDDEFSVPIPPSKSSVSLPNKSMISPLEVLLIRQSKIQLENFIETQYGKGYEYCSSSFTSKDRFCPAEKPLIGRKIISASAGASSAILMAWKDPVCNSSLN